MMELGVQGYESAFDTTFYISIGSQYLISTGLDKDYDEVSVNSGLDENFEKQTETNFSLMMIGFGWFF